MTDSKWVIRLCTTSAMLHVACCLPQQIPLCTCRVTQAASFKAYLDWLRDRASISEQEAGCAKAQVITINVRINGMQQHAENWARRAESLCKEAARLREELLQHENAAHSPVRM